MKVGDGHMKVLICINDEEYMSYLWKSIQTLSCYEDICLESYTDATNIRRRLEEELFDMAILGSQIGHENGFELGRYIKSMQSDCILFFVCDTYQQIHEGFRTGAFQMLLKNQKELLKNEFLRAYEFYCHIHFQIHFDTGEKHPISLIPREILYIEKEKTSQKVVTFEEDYLGYFPRYTMTKEKLKDYHFIQVHPSYYVNMNYIDALRCGEVELINGDVVPVSARHRLSIDRMIQGYLESL